MFFLQAMQVPVNVVMGDKYLQIPKMTLSDFAEWGEEVRQDMAEKAYGHLDDDRRTQVMALHPVMPPTRHDLRMILSTEKGMERVVCTCLARAKVFEAVKKTKQVKTVTPEPMYETTYVKGKLLPDLTVEEIVDVIEANIGRLPHLVTELADMNDHSMLVSPQQAKENEEEGGEQAPADPLP